MSVMLNGKLRSKTGKNHAKEARREGFLPAVVYGQKETVPIAVNQKELMKIIKQNGRNALIELDLKSDTIRKVLLKEFQLHPLKETWVHADFYEVDLTKPLKVQVPVKLIGTSPGEKKGGTLNQVIRVLNMECLPNNIPGVIEASIDSLELEEAIRVSDLKVPENANVLNPPSATVAIIHIEKKEEEKEEDKVPEDGEGEVAPTETTDDAEKK